MQLLPVREEYVATTYIQNPGRVGKFHLSTEFKATHSGQNGLFPPATFVVKLGPLKWQQKKGEPKRFTFQSVSPHRQPLCDIKEQVLER